MDWKVYWPAIRRRVIAVLDYDEIPEHERASYLVRTCGLSRYKANRLLDEAGLTRKKIRGGFELDIARRLNVSIMWLCFGEFREFHQRTFRIHIQSFLQYSKSDTDRVMRMLVGSIAGHRKARNLVDLVVNNQLSAVAAAALL